MNGLLWIYKVVRMMVWWLNMTIVIIWCIFSVNRNVKSMWSCWINMERLLVLIYVMCIYVVGEFSYMLLVLNCLCKHVLKYVGVNCWSVWIYALLLSSHRSTHCWCRISYSCWWRILCIQLFRVIIRGDYDVQLASGVTASEVLWYHTCLESV